MLSQTAEYALRAVLYLADARGDQPVQVGEMAAALRIPRNYLSKILHRLAQGGVLTSSRGKRGGFLLGVAPERLHLIRIVAPFDRVDLGRRCLLGRPQCSNRNSCAAHGRWKEVSEKVTTFFRETTVADLQQGASVAV